MEVEEYTPTDRNESLQIYSWRLRCLVAAGVPSDDAISIANSGVDLHQACELAEHGCAPHLLARILL